MSAITNIRYKSVCYIEVFLWEFDRDSVGSLKKCPLLPGVRYKARRYRQVWLYDVWKNGFSMISLSNRTLIVSLLLEQKSFEQKLTHKMVATSLRLVADAQIIQSNTG